MMMMMTPAVQLISLLLLGIVARCSNGIHQCSKHQKDALQEGSTFVPRCQANLMDYAPRQCKGQSCACVSRAGINITEWSSNIINCNCPVTVYEIRKAGGSDSPVPVCNADGSFAPLVCEETACWTINTVSGERALKSRTSDTSPENARTVSAFDTEDYQEPYMDRSARRRRSAPSEDSLHDNYAELPDNGVDYDENKEDNALQGRRHRTASQPQKKNDYDVSSHDSLIESADIAIKELGNRLTVPPFDGRRPPNIRSRRPGYLGLENRAPPRSSSGTCVNSQLGTYPYAGSKSSPWNAPKHGVPRKLQQPGFHPATGTSHLSARSLLQF